MEALLQSVAKKRISKLLSMRKAEGNIFDHRKTRNPILMYVHIPFCLELCPYCSFHRLPFDENLAKRYFKALRDEILIYKSLGFEFEGTYVGGGTPTILIDELLQTLDLIKDSFSIKEISVETNPNHLSTENLKLLKSAGVKRLSVGVQSFDDEILKSVKRYHKYGSGKEIMEKIKEANGYFHTLNIDMIFNFPNQTIKSLENDLKLILELKIKQVTYYPLMISHFTRRKMEKELGTVDFKREKMFYELILDTLKDEYFPATAWCFSRTKGMIDEYVVNYDEYAGLGSGSIGYVDGFAYANTFDIEKYISKLRNGELPIEGVRFYTKKERIQYDFLMKLFGLKLNLDELEKKYGPSTLFMLLPEIFFFSALGAIKVEKPFIFLTRDGLYYWVMMMREFFTAVNNFRDFLRGISNTNLQRGTS